MAPVRAPPPKKATSEWNHNPAYLQAGTNTTAKVDDEEFPIGTPFEFDTPYFSGKCVMKFKNVNTDDEYFTGRKRVMMNVIQGQFKQEIPMNELYIGCIYDDAFLLQPPAFANTLLRKFFDAVNPGITFNFNTNGDDANDKPYVLGLMGGAIQTLAISDSMDSAPDIMDINLPEDVQDLFVDKKNKAGDIKNRKKLLSNPKTAGNYSYVTDKVYTFHSYDQAMNYGAYTMKLPVVGDMDLTPIIGRTQPMKISAIRVPYCDKKQLKKEKKILKKKLKDGSNAGEQQTDQKEDRIGEVNTDDSESSVLSNDPLTALSTTLSPANVIKNSTVIYSFNVWHANHDNTGEEVNL